MSSLQQATGDVSNSQSLIRLMLAFFYNIYRVILIDIPINNLNPYIASGNLNTPDIFGEADEIITVPVSIVEASNIYSFTISFEYDNDASGVWI